MKLKNYILFIISIYQLFFCNVYSQTTIPDSLFNEINKAEKICPQPCPNDSNIAILFLKIGDFFENENPDTAKYFYKQALKVSKSIKNPKYEAKSLLYIGYIFENKGDYLQPLNYYYTAIKILIPLNDIKDIAASYISIGNCFYSQGNFQKAIENMLKALHYYEEMYKKASSPIDLYDSRRGVCASLSNIGCVHTDMGNYKSALEYHNKALKIYFEISKSNSEKEKTFGKGGISRCYNNIGNVYDYQGKFQLALEYYKKSIKIKKELNDIRGICLLYNNIGNIYGQIGEYAQAIETYRNSLTKYKELDDKTGLSLVNGNISALYIMLADSMAFSQSAKLNYLNKAITYGLESYNIANKINAVPQLNEAASQLKTAYKKTGNLEKAIEFSDIYIATKDSMFQEEKTKAIAEMETKYQTEKQQLQIDNYQKANQLHISQIKQKQAEINQQRILLFSFICGFIIILIFSFWLIKIYNQKKKANKILKVQNVEIRQQKEEISAQRDEIEAQRDIVTIQKNKIEEVHETLKSSIRYAQQIQDAALPTHEQITDILYDYFIIYKPRDIVSGDFYWTTKIKKWIIFCVADCTGHGVPGAFMSMLGISLLNEIVRKEEVTNAADVLNYLRNNIITALKQKNIIYSDNKVKDGMDISLCVLDTETLKLQFAGANNPLYIIRKNPQGLTKPKPFRKNPQGLTKPKPLQNLEGLEEQNNKLSEIQNLKVLDVLEEIKGDKMPIAVYLHMEPFTLQEIQLQKGDLLYLFSDGFADQFGGPNNKKYRYKAFKELFTNNYNNTMQEQKEIIELAFENWKGSNPQLDDVTILGVKI